MIAVTQRTQSGPKDVYVHPDNIEHILPWPGGAMIKFVSGNSIEVAETPEQILSKIKE